MSAPRKLMALLLLPLLSSCWTHPLFQSYSGSSGNDDSSALLLLAALGRGTLTDNGLTVGGTVSGLDGTGLVLSLNGSETVTVNASGSFVFPTGLADGSSYSVSVQTAPANPVEFCAISNGTGNIAGVAVNNVGVTCTGPADSSNLELWLDAAKGVTVATGVSNWSDQTSNGRDLAQGSVTLQPQLISDSLNGLPVIRSDGMDDFLLNSTGTVWSLTDFTIVVAVRLIDGGTGGGLVSFRPSTGADHNSSDAIALRYRNGTSGDLVAERQPGGNVFIATEMNNTPTGERVVALSFGGGTGTIYGNGTQVASDIYSDLTSLDPIGLIIGARWAGGSDVQHTITEYAEIIIFNGTDSAQRENLECYFQTKYNITGVSNGTCD